MNELEIIITEEVLTVDVIEGEMILIDVVESDPVILDIYDGVIFTQVNAGGSQSDQQLITSPGSYSSGRLLAWVGGSLVYYDVLNAAHLYALTGLSLVAANTGEPLQIAARGEVCIAGWGLVPDQIYHAAASGMLSTSPTAGAAFSQVIGRAKDSNTLIFSPQTVFKNA